MKRQLFYSGTSGLELPVPNKEFYPPEFRNSSRLTYYGSLFNSIEINSSFYKIPMPVTVRKWAESVPKDFRFTFKLFKGITHNKGLVFSEEDVMQFMDTIAQAGDRKGCLLIQFPPSLKVIHSGQLEKLLDRISRADPDKQWNLAVEFRNRSWYDDHIYELLFQYRAEIVRHDMPASSPPFLESDSLFTYFRFHGPGGSYRGSYSDDFLLDHAQAMQDLISEGKEVYVYFNNTVGGAVQNLLRLNEHL
ncbi:DUF72 domain-containing protein [Dyadobacter psychrotolerans]|uniref:DUF72 domain-containing protein n=1 Tax=Dyadobacter psychrotolerans TaxID=2541721 RepID=A0A4R5DKB6_9BACT|nr:DUF72 domain-containing protein [Dyadobacter psychrotolerans]TDE11285.1 DUF72 domain-containing protein [Dyadobacter psychrotolerans]